MNKPNLFHFATSELSQDAVLCWILAWAHIDLAQDNPALHKLAQKIIEISFKKVGRKAPAVITSLKVERQKENIDILITINTDFKLLIEDKTGTEDHSGQLKRYLTKLISLGYQEQNIAPVYVQTGEQSNYKRVEDAGFGVVTRAELLILLADALLAGADNDILLDFHAHLSDMEHQFQSL